MSLTKKTKKLANKKVHIDAGVGYIDVYLFYPYLGGLEKKGNFAHFFAGLEDIDEQLSECIVFLDQQSALSYSRLISASHVVLKTSVCHAAVAGSGDKLELKKGFLAKGQVHGCFPGWAKGTMYLENPDFDCRYAVNFSDVREE